MTARPLPARHRSLMAAVRAAGAMALVMALASCSLLNGGDKNPPAATAKADPSIVASAPAGLEKFYSQEVVWQPCEGEFQCAKVTVPLDYANPAGDTIQIAALRAPSTGKKTGSLLVNPGGPGASGYDFVKDAAATHFSAAVRNAYDLVGFDPRGVKRSAPVTCMTDAERDAARAKTYALETDTGLAAALADNKAIAAQCAAQTGPVMAHIDTVSAAKDLDVLRAVVNDTKLNYLGYSYGTFLGSTYASLFPDNVGRMVLDGALDPSISNEDLTSGQAARLREGHPHLCRQLPAAGQVPADRRRRLRRAADPGPHQRGPTDAPHGQGRPPGQCNDVRQRPDHPALQRPELACTYASAGGRHER